MSDTTDITPASNTPNLWREVMHAPALLADPATVGNDAAVEQMGRMESLARFLRELAKQVSDEREAFGLAVLAHRGSLDGGGVRYYAGTDKRTKCKDAKALLGKLLEVSDIDTIATLLASDPWKQGACREVLGDEWGEHFEVTERAELKEGKPAKKVQKALV